MNSDELPGPGVVHPSPTGWRKSSHSSANANCVEINFGHPDFVHVRGQQGPRDRPDDAATRHQWTVLLDQITFTTASTMP